MAELLGYLALPALVVLVLALLAATDPADINLYCAMWRRIRGN